MLYTLPAGAFHKITSGHNLAAVAGGPYYAGGNYNLVTGLGSPVANVLVPALVGAPVLASLQREGIHQHTTIDLSLFGAGPGTGPRPRQLQAAGGGPSWELLPQDPPAFSEIQRGDPDGGARAEASVPESHVRAAGQGHVAARAEGRNGIFLAGGNQTVIFSGFTPSSPVAVGLTPEAQGAIHTPKIHSHRHR